MALQDLSNVLNERQAWEDWKSLKDKVDPWRVLEYFGADNIQEEMPTGEVIHSCLIEQSVPHHSHGDKTPSASLNVEDGLYSCWGYSDKRGRNGGDLLWLVQQIEQCSAAKAVEILKGLVLDDDSIKDRQRQELLNIVQAMKDLRKPKGLTDEYKVYPMSMLDLWTKEIHPYWLERGLTEETIRSHYLGWDSSAKRLVIPVIFKGQLVGWQKRVQLDPRWEVTTENPKAKYKNSFGFPKDRVLYGYDDARKDDKFVVVTEGPVDAITLHQRGINAVATFSAKVMERQLELLRYWDEVVVFFDRDKAGISGMENILKSLNSCTNVSVILPKAGEDANSITEERTHELIDNRTSGLEIELVWPLKKFMDS